MAINRICKLIWLTTAIAPFAFADEPGGVQTGKYQLSSSMLQVVGESTARHTEKLIAPDELLTWEIYVPENYRSDNPPGLMVYISPTPSGEIPRDWETVMEDRNLIWVAANESGNSVIVARRAIFAMIAPTLIQKQYKVDTARVYLSGLSGGGKMASMVATDNAHLFKGAIYNCGVDFWQRDPPQRFEQIKQNHYVFVTGTFDQALEPTKKVYKQYRKAGVENIKLMVIRNMTHRNPNRFKFSEAIEFLDSRLDMP
jgi:poly(3-hydroxybutyrate) depolymerase